MAYEPNQFKVKKFMGKPKKAAMAKTVVAPIPGSIISINVKPGEKSDRSHVVL